MINRINFLKFILSLITILVFNIGLISNFIPSTSIKLIIDLLCLIFIVSGVNSNNSILYQYAKTLPLFTVVFYSFLINEGAIFKFLIFTKSLLYPFFMVPVILTTYKNYKNFIASNFYWLLQILLIEQFLYSIYKLVNFGFKEDIIGTMSLNNGSLALIYFIFCIIFYFSKYRKINYSFLIYVLIAMSVPIASLKRASIFIFPIIVTFIFISSNIKKVNAKQVIYYPILIFCGLYFLVYLNSKVLNETTSQSVSDLIEYSIEYETREKFVDGNVISGRFSVFNLFFSDKSNREKILLGNGPGSTFYSSLDSSAAKFSVLNSNYGYGIRIGFFYFVLQIGIIGFLIYLIYFFRLLEIKKTPNYTNLILKRSIVVLFVIDLMYSNTIFFNITGIFFLILLISISKLPKSKMQIIKK